MNFTFPEKKLFHYGVLKQVQNNWYKPVLMDPLTPLQNLISIAGVDYYFTYLEPSGKTKGGNSIILKLFESQNVDIEDIEYDEPDLILKILKSKSSGNPKLHSKAEKRFLKEIDALLNCKKNKFQNVVTIYHNGTCIINNYKKGTDSHLFYTMEYAQSDLKQYIETTHESLSLEEKISFCISLSNGLREMESLGYYHRDIKPDNIFMIDDQWKIGDLGLISERYKESEIDKDAELIGPRGWLTPESMNKYLCEGKSFKYSHDCIIDHQSDIFQLGKIFWYIFQHNAPIGTVKSKDFNIKSEGIFPILKTMLNHSKKRRYKRIDEIIHLLKPIENRLI